MEQDFVSRFLKMARVSAFFGLYLPGVNVHVFKKWKQFLYIYAIIFNLIVFYDVVDWFLTAVIYFGKKTDIEVFYLLMCSFMYSWQITNCLYFVVYKKDITEMVEAWNDLQPVLWPDIREKYVDEAHLLAQKKLRNMILSLLVPYIVQTIIQVYLGDLFIASLLAYSGTTTEAPRIAIIMQGVPIIGFMAGYCAYTSIFTLIQRLLLAELDYLHECITKVLTVNTDNYGTSSCGSNVNLHQAKIAHARMRLLTQYHAQVLKFGNQVKTVYGPLVLLQFFFLTTTQCSILYCASTGIMPTETSITTLLFVGFFSLMALSSCRLADKIYEKSYTFGDAGIYSDWMNYPNEIQKSLIFITRISRNKPLVIVGLGGLYPLNSQSYLQLTFLQYKFFQFMAEVGNY